MAARKKTQAKEAPSVSTEPKFPYTTKPSSLRRLLKEIPSKPRPQKIDKTLMRSWGFSDTNDMTILRVLKAVNLINERNEPTDVYSQFMNLAVGPRALGPEVKRLYAPMFQASLTPFNESLEKLRNLFNIHSGGGDRTLENQIQTFKALCENAVFDNSDPVLGSPAPIQSTAGAPVTSQYNAGATIHINLHIHLPENKTSRDYQNIIEDIGRHIFGRNVGGENVD